MAPLTALCTSRSAPRRRRWDEFFLISSIGSSMPNQRVSNFGDIQPVNPGDPSIPLTRQPVVPLFHRRRKLDNSLCEVNIPPSIPVKDSIRQRSIERTQDTITLWFGQDLSLKTTDDGQTCLVGRSPPISQQDEVFLKKLPSDIFVRYLCPSKTSNASDLAFEHYPANLHHVLSAKINLGNMDRDRLAQMVFQTVFVFLCASG